MTWIRRHLIPSPGGESGVALAFVLAMILVIVLITATLVALAMNEYQTAGRAEQSLQAIQIANGAAHRAIYELKRDTVWDDTLGATQKVDAAGQWRPLWDGAADVVNHDFPSTGPVGRITIELCRYDDATFCPGVANPVVTGCTAATCIWVRATGRVGAASRQVEVLLGQLSLHNELIQYSNSSVNIGAGGGGNGVFTLHGSLYIADCQDPDGGGPQPCIGLQMQGNAAILNDVPFPIPGDPDTLPPFNNRVWVNGTITGQGNSWQIGLDNQLMLGVHTTVPWASAYDNQIDALDRSRMVPFLDFPDPSRPCDATSPRRCLINRLYLPGSVPVGDPDGRIVPRNAMRAYVCERPGGVCTQAQWQEVDLNNSTRLVTFATSGSAQARVLIPDRDGAGSPVINCRGSAASATMCSNTAGAPADVDGPNNFTLVFNGFRNPFDTNPPTPNLFTQRHTPGAEAYIHTRARLQFDGNRDIVYSGSTTFLVEGPVPPPPPTEPRLDIRTSLTPACKVSEGTACPQTFGRDPTGSPPGQTLAFAVGPACAAMPCAIGGDIYVRGANRELNLVLLAHGTLKNDNPQSWYGLFIANLLDWDNNPQIYPVAGLRDFPPPGVPTLIGSGFGVVIYRWREVF